ncbi:MAG TPA: creatininase family protein [bacterium]|nr:creatininase family protein [bacterium]
MEDHKKQIQFLRPDEIIKERDENGIIFLPIGPLEWHGPHLPLGVDPLRAEYVAIELAKRIGGVVLPTFYIGTERERSPQMLKNIGFEEDDYIIGMDFPDNSLKSLYFKEEVFAVLLRNILEMLIEKWNYKTIIIVNGHGGENHVNVIRRLKIEFERERDVKIITIFPALNFPNSKWSHATKEETETIMSIYPECVDLKKLPQKPEKLKNKKFAIVDDLTFRGTPTEDFTVRDEEDPRDATVESGRKIFETTVEQLEKIIKKEIEGKD